MEKGVLLQKEKKNKLVKPYKRFQSQYHVKKKKAYRCSQVNAYCLLSFREYTTLIFVVDFVDPQVTLHEGQGHRHDHERICHA